LKEIDMSKRTIPKLFGFLIFIFGTVGCWEIGGTMLRSFVAGLICGLVAMSGEYLVRWHKFSDWMRLALWIFLSGVGVTQLIIISNVKVDRQLLIYTVPYAFLCAICRYSSWKTFPAIKARGEEILRGRAADEHKK